MPLLPTAIANIGIPDSTLPWVCPSTLLTWWVILRILFMRLVLLIPLSCRLFLLLKTCRLIWLMGRLGTLAILLPLIAPTLFPLALLGLKVTGSFPPSVLLAYILPEWLYPHNLPL